MNNIGELKVKIPQHCEIYHIGDIVKADSKINGQEYKAKVIKIKRVEWVESDLIPQIIVTYMVRSVNDDK